MFPALGRMKLSLFDTNNSKGTRLEGQIQSLHLDRWWWKCRHTKEMSDCIGLEFRDLGQRHPHGSCEHMRPDEVSREGSQVEKNTHCRAWVLGTSTKRKSSSKRLGKSDQWVRSEGNQGVREGLGVKRRQCLLDESHQACRLCWKVKLDQSRELSFRFSKVEAMGNVRSNFRGERRGSFTYWKYGKTTMIKWGKEKGKKWWHLWHLRHRLVCKPSRTVLCVHKPLFSHDSIDYANSLFVLSSTPSWIQLNLLSERKNNNKRSPTS